MNPVIAGVFWTFVALCAIGIAATIVELWVEWRRAIRAEYDRDLMRIRESSSQRPEAVETRRTDPGTAAKAQWARPAGDGGPNIPLACGHAHSGEWTLYGGLEGPFVYCNRCGATCGPRECLRVGLRGVAFGVADWKLQEAAKEIALGASVGATDLVLAEQYEKYFAKKNGAH